MNFVDFLGCFLEYFLKNLLTKIYEMASANYTTEYQYESLSEESDYNNDVSSSSENEFS